MVDYVGINKWPTAVETLRLLRPDVYCKGSEYRKNQVDAQSNMLPEVAEAGKLGIDVEYTEDITSSSSELINRYFSHFSPATGEWLHQFRKEHDADEVIEVLAALRSLKVLLVGEAIIDEYLFCTSIGKSTKDPVLACQYQDTESIAGGSMAVANHVAGFCDRVGLVTCLGARERRADRARRAHGRRPEGLDAAFLKKAARQAIETRGPLYTRCGARARLHARARPRVRARPRGTRRTCCARQ